jgi:hypothetical protein
MNLEVNFWRVLMSILTLEEYRTLIEVHDEMCILQGMTYGKVLEVLTDSHVSKFIDKETELGVTEFEILRNKLTSNPTEIVL